jgi:hypothetical protein
VVGVSLRFYVCGCVPYLPIYYYYLRMCVRACVYVCLIIDSCKRVALCFDDVISSIEVVNSQGVQVQVSMMCSCNTLLLSSKIAAYVADIWLL